MMRITTWNVNGIRAAMGKGLKKWLITESPDVLCLQEIKAMEIQLDDEQKNFPGYGTIWNSAQKPGYSGVATLLKEQPFEVMMSHGEERFDIEGRIIRTRHPGFYLYNTLVSPKAATEP